MPRWIEKRVVTAEAPGTPSADGDESLRPSTAGRPLCDQLLGRSLGGGNPRCIYRVGVSGFRLGSQWRSSGSWLLMAAAIDGIFRANKQACASSSYYPYPESNEPMGPPLLWCASLIFPRSFFCLARRPINIRHTQSNQIVQRARFTPEASVVSLSGRAITPQPPGCQKSRILVLSRLAFPPPQKRKNEREKVAV